MENEDKSEQTDARTSYTQDVTNMFVLAHDLGLGVLSHNLTVANLNALHARGWIVWDGTEVSSITMLDRGLRMLERAVSHSYEPTPR